MTAGIARSTPRALFDLVAGVNENQGFGRYGKFGVASRRTASRIALYPCPAANKLHHGFTAQATREGMALRTSTPTAAARAGRPFGAPSRSVPRQLLRHPSGAIRLIKVTREPRP